jgi:hypothetical protein
VDAGKREETPAIERASLDDINLERVDRLVAAAERVIATMNTDGYVPLDSLAQLARALEPWLRPGRASSPDT